MFNEIFQFELRFRFRQISTYIYFSVMFLLAFLSITTDVVSLGGATGKALINSPLQISQAAVILTAFGMFITAAIMGTPVYRDFKEGIYPLFFTTAMDKRSYLAGRFVGSFVVTVFAFSGILVGFWIGTLMPWMDAEKLAAFNFASYSEAFFNIILPNVFFSGAFFFAAYAITRNALSIYLSGIALFSVYFAALTLTRDYTNDTLAAMLDPFTFRTLSVVTKYWTIAERNVLHTTLSGLLLYNRLAWLAGGLVLLGLAFSVFKLSVPRQAASKIVENEAEEPSAAQPETLVVMRDFGATAQAKQFFQIAGLEFRSIVRAWSFIALSLLGIVNVLLNATQLGKTFGTTTYPVTYLVLDLVGNSFSLFVIIIITVYAGELVWRERELNLDLVFDALPIPNWVMSLSKLTALVLVQALLLVLLMVTGILLQLSKGYTNIEFGLYLKDFALNFIGYIQVCTLAILVHTLVNQKYIGHGVMILYYIALIAAVPLGFEHLLYQIFGNIPYTYSDMNGYGHFVSRIVWFNVYFTVIAVFFAVLTNLFWVRGAETTFSKRWYLFKQRFTGGAKASFVAALVGILGTGGFIFYNTNVVNTYETKKSRDAQQADYEKAYKKFAKLTLPKITDVKLAVDIFPDTRRFDIKGSYIIRNKTSKPIDSLVVLLDKSLTVRMFTFSRPNTLVLDDKNAGLRLYTFATPLKPNDTLRVEMDYSFVTKGFKNSYPTGGFFADVATDNRITENGTFIDSGILPHFGYAADGEVTDDDDRKKAGLPPKERMANINDSLARLNTDFGADADWVRFEATVSTSPDQIAIAPGYLQKEWTENGRRYFSYKMDKPILNFYSFLSARYDVRRDKWNNVNIEIYYHKAHPYNVERMVKSVKKSLDYYTKNFGAYQFSQVRIFEFPRYASFAQSFPNSIPYSESAGFIANVDADENKIDGPFYITAHEVAHQWWGHQVVPGAVQGSTLMVESMAEYSSLMVMEHEYGKDKMQKFLGYDLDRYLQGRHGERKKELPLMLVENQPYIHYAKGSLIMYALQDYIGEDTLNAALKKYLQGVKFQEPPYTYAVDFVNTLKAATPDSLRYLITDMFETITLFENKTTEATATALPNGKYLVKLSIDAQKLRADSLGNETVIPLADWIDVGVFAKSTDGEKIGKPLYLKKVKITQPKTDLEITVDERPDKAGIDPYNKLIDRHPKDNVKTVEVADSKVASK